MPWVKIVISFFFFFSTIILVTFIDPVEEQYIVLLSPSYKKNKWLATHAINI